MKFPKKRREPSPFAQPLARVKRKRLTARRDEIGCVDDHFAGIRDNGGGVDRGATSVAVDGR